MRVQAEVVGKVECREDAITGYAGGPDLQLYVLLASTGEVPRHRVVRYPGDSEWTIEGEFPHFHFVQPLAEGLLLAHARHSWDGPNGYVLDADGILSLG